MKPSEYTRQWNLGTPIRDTLGPSPEAVAWCLYGVISTYKESKVCNKIIEQEVIAILESFK